MIAHRPIRAAVLHDVEIERGDAPVLVEAHLDAARHVGPRAADVALLLAADPHHHRRVGLARQQRRNRHRHGAAALAAEPPARVLADQHDVGRRDAHPARDVFDGALHALGGGMQVQLAVLPVGHRAAGLHRVVPGGLHDERLVEHERGLLEPRVDIAVSPLLDRRASRQRSLRRGGKVLVGPPHGLHRHRRWRRHARRRGRPPDISLLARARTVGPQGVDRVGHERQRLEIDHDALDGFSRRQLVHRGHRGDRLAGIEGLVGERALDSAEIRQVVRRQDRLDARQRQRGARVNRAHARMRHRAHEQLAEEHPVRAEVLGVARAAGHLGDMIERNVVLADKLLSHLRRPPHGTRVARISEVRILS